MFEIERSRHAQKFVTLGNAQARDKRLSRRARGFLVELLSYPPGRRINSETLQEGGPEGRDAIRAALNELEQHGYITRTKGRNERGHWTTTLTVHDVPQTADSQPDPPVDNPAEAAQPEPGNPSPVRPAETHITAGQSRAWKSGVGQPVAKDLIRSTEEVPTSAAGTTDRRSPYVRSGDCDLSPENKTKIIEAFRFGQLYQSRTDIPDLRPAASYFCRHCRNVGDHPSHRCTTLTTGVAA